MSLFWFIFFFALLSCFFSSWVYFLKINPLFDVYFRFKLRADILFLEFWEGGAIYVGGKVSIIELLAVGSSWGAVMKANTRKW